MSDRSANTRIWLDVGAHLGEKTFGPATDDPSLRVFAFEPIWEIACQRMGRLPNYIVIPAAVAEQPGIAEFHLNRFLAASSLLPFNPTGLEAWDGGEELREVHTLRVPTLRLDRFLELMGIRTIDFLKVDAQGADLQVIRSLGERLGTVAALNLEVQITPQELYAGGSGKQEILDYLTTRGFELTGTELQSRGQEENLTFQNRQLQQAVEESSELLTSLVQEAGSPSLRPLGPYPGWRFGIGEDDPDFRLQRRRLVWSYFQERHTFPPVLLDWLEGLKIQVRMGDDFSRLLYLTGCYEPNECWLLAEVLQTGMTVIDAGANVGLYSTFCGKRVGPTGAVWAFEPSLREFAGLVGNVTRNGLGWVRPIPIALADQDTVADLRIAEAEHSGQSTLGGFAHIVEQVGTEPVLVRTLDTFARAVGIERVDLIKMDVEGAELALIRGAQEIITRDRPVLLFEANEKALLLQQASTEALLRALQELGYELFAEAEDGTYHPARGRVSDNMVAAHPANMPRALAARR